MRRISYIIPVIVVILVLALSSVFIVDERNKALVLQFGRVVAIKEDPGLSFKLPFILRRNPLRVEKGRSSGMG